ncbi:MAG: helix-turn-helix transcriptional regulator [Steroidobacteraceae bacterium]
MLLRQDVTEYARSIARDCDIDSTVVFISDKTTPLTQLFYLGNFGVSEEVLSRYRRFGICDADPFTDVHTHESHTSSGFRAVDDPVIARCGSRAGSYWDFVSQHDVDVVGASTLRLQPRLYLAIGVHRLKATAHRGVVPVERLSHSIEVLQNKIAANLLALLLDGGKGYRTLLEVVSSRPEPTADVLGRLSARETQVARLVCEGRQNKEIAWIASLSEYTVENHLRRIYQKLGIRNRAALVARMSTALS